MTPKQQRIADILTILKQKNLLELDALYEQLTPGLKPSIEAESASVPMNNSQRSKSRPLRAIQLS
jgi:hypothetical protein